jgi:hypothetical protein
MKHGWKTEAHADEWDYIYSVTEANAQTGTYGGEFGNLPYPLEAFGDLLSEVDLYDEVYGDHCAKTLLDVGCGNGQLIAIASVYFGLEAQGIEINGDLLAAAYRLLEGLGRPAELCSAWCEDADFFQGYGDYDIVVLNRLYVGPAAQLELEEYIWSELKPGAYMIKLNNVSDTEDIEIIASNNLGGIVARKPSV